MTTLSRPGHATGFWFVALAFASLMAFGTLPTPLWPLYQARDHFGPTQVTIAFAVMVAGAAISFGALGHLSDRFGRRRIIAPALVVGIGAALVLAAWPTLPGLIVGRVLTGIAVGLMASTATAYLTDLHRAAHPDRAGSGVPMLTSTVANLGGLALGPLLAGILAQWLPAPLVTSYVLLAGVMAGLLVLVLSTPETVDRLGGAGAARPSRFALRPGAARLFGAAAAVGFFAFALMGFFSSLGAIVVRGQLGITSTFVVGLAPFTAFAASAAAQILLGKAPQRRLLVAGSGLFPVGLAVTAAALYHPTLGWFLTGAALAGAGAGLLFKAAATQTVLAADPASRAGVLAVFFIIAYAGMGLPSIAFSIVIRYAALAPTMVGFGAVLALGTIAAVVTTIRRIR
ncbi:putative MFS family arabinose efflux permease [Asanoa ferruginea]|uniref:Putative MFS family arabinose efflux permease n=1 Tax=Asanoa ferruginea TaxID=53367 RepID=A0A3D9ZYW1_9ACTN|nr:MFS transporter [Asanoa ferruginea]REF99010.1 putative MFS family arabinose efflux permease [Asanoa ferruginea]GIF46307.1 MFS transporter [Asanoa ferruginea]